MLSEGYDRWRWPSKVLLVVSALLLMAFTIDNMLKQLLLLLSTFASIFAAPIQPRLNPNTLRFTTAGTFQLSIFEDLHYGEGEDTTWGPQHDIQSTGVMNTVLNFESQQLVVLNGDLITGENTCVANATSYIDEIVAPLVQHGLAWASTYGNHDSDFNLSREAILKRETSYPNSYTKCMVNTSPESGVSNYYLPVYSATADAPTQAPSLLLWFFDSRGGNYYQALDVSGNRVAQPDWVDVSVVDWFTSTKVDLALKYGTIPSIAFVHIPIRAFLAFQEGGVSPTQSPGINDDDPLAPQANEANYSGEDVPFMEALLNTPGLIAIFSGHDHGDDWCAKWDTKLPGMNLTGNGLDLCFGRHSGYGGYGTWTRGSRQVLFDEVDLQQLRTWIRLEDGEVSGSVVLNGTYGTDQYPPVTDTHTK